MFVYFKDTNEYIYIDIEILNSGYHRFSKDNQG